MFGYDEAELERIRSGPPRLRLWVLALLLVLAVLPVALAMVLRVVNDPVRLEAWVDRAFVAAPFEIGLEEFEVLPVGSWSAPLSWRFAVTGLTYTPRDATKPSWRAERISAGLPEPQRSTGRWVAHFGEIAVSALDIQAHQQRPPEPWEPKDTLVYAVTADSVHVRGAGFRAPPDPPLGEAAAAGVHGTLSNLVFLPGRREVSASGHLRVRSFTTGAITVTNGDLPEFVLDRSSLHLAGTFSFAGARGHLEGDIKTFHVRSEVAMHVTLQDGGLGTIIETATGDPTNIDGRLNLDLQVEAGGDRPRGSSRLWGSVEVRDGRIQLGRQTRYVVLDVLSVLPWIELNAYNQVQLRPLDGRIEFTRGKVTLMDWSYPIGKRNIRVDGTIIPDDLWLFVRLSPPAEHLDRPGLGMLMWGSADQQQFKLATREDLARPDPWVKVVPQASPPEELGGKPLFRRRARSGAQDEPAVTP